MRTIRLLPPALVLLAAGCAHPPAFTTYRLVPQALVPPGVASPDLSKRTFVAPVARGKNPCRNDAGSIQLQARGSKLRVTVDRDALAQQKQPGWLNDFTTRAESEGCIATGQGQKLGQAIVESIPLDPAIAFRLLHANDVQNGYVELNAENQLEVRSPIVRDAEAPRSEEHTSELQSPVHLVCR